MRPDRLEPFESAWETCNKMDGNLVEIYTELELEAAMEAIKTHHLTNNQIISVWTGAIKNMTKGATEKSYYWNITRSEVNFTLLAHKDPQSCPEKENCTLILSDEGKVIPKSYKVWNKAVC